MKRLVLLPVAFAVFATLVLLANPAPQAQQSPFVNLAQVTNDELVDLYPDVDPSGQKIAYMSYRLKSQYIGNFDIMVMDVKTSQTKVLDADEADDAFPSWMPDGETVLFNSYRRVDVHTIWKKRVTGGALEKLANLSEVAFGADCGPQRIVFNATDQIKKDIDLRRDGLFFVKEFKKMMPNIYTVDPNGANLRFMNIQGINPKWSPDGKRIVFASNKFGNYEIFTLSVDGSDLMRLTSREAQDVEPAWSPDGRFIVFTSNQDDNWNLWVIKPDGTGLTQLTSHKGYEGGPSWAIDPADPEAWYIYFHSNNNDNWDIWRLRPTEFKPLPNPALHDKDKDGIPDDRDRCIDQPEDIDNFEDQDGCPDPDNDRDSFPDGTDRCPNEAEDIDSFQDTDGCPDPDNDGDGVLDAQDKCAREPETMNGYQDADGCPDQPPITNNMPLAVKFKDNSAEIPTESTPALVALVDKLKDWPTVRVRIKVYTDQAQHKRKPTLTRLRAEAIKRYLVSLGIAESRIEAIGMGDTNPLGDNRTFDGRRINNRVLIEVVQ